MMNEKWWESKDYWYEDPNGSIQPRWSNMIEEAERRGEVKAWSEIVQDVEEATNPFDKEWLGPPGGTWHAFETLIKLLIGQIDAKRKQLKLTSLKTP